MHSELHERLEYLVNYSSQLIFVSGDSIAQQQRTLEAFVFQQHDDTEIAYVTAEPDMELSDYRRQLCRQLLGQVVGSYVRPLNELLSSLNQHEGPILITLTQAQHMPDKLLQELWDLVLQSRFAGNKQHLNVLLFGETQWAENAKQWLPAKNTDTPLLISSQSVHSEPEASDLDRLIARKREDFQHHMARRYGQSQGSIRPTLKSPWFVAAVSVVFLGLFGSLVAWQYGSDISSLFSPLKSEPVSANSTAVVPGSAFNKITEPSTALTPDNEAKRAENSAALGTDNDQDGQLVTQWQAAVDALPRKQADDNPVTDGRDATSAQKPAEHLQPKAPPANPDAVASDALPATSLTARNQQQDPSDIVEPQVNDTPVANLVEGEKADTSVPEVVAPEPVNNENTLIASTVRQDDFMLQLAGLKDRQLLAEFVSDNNLSALTKVYRTQRYGGNWYVVLFHQPFGSLQEARQALSALPDYPGRENAFVKRGNQILAELAAAE